MMEVDVNKSIMDYIIDQAERYDGMNLKLEHSILHSIDKSYGTLDKRIMDITRTYGDFRTLLQMQNMLTRIQQVAGSFANEAYSTLVPFVEEHMNTGYSDFDDLLTMSMELRDWVDSQKVTEMAGKVADSSAIAYMRDHAFQYVTDITNDMMMKLRNQLGQMVAGGQPNSKDVMRAVQSIMDTTRSRAETIAQTEMSMAYNNGALDRLSEYNQSHTDQVMKYWHGFKYSEVTCTYCRPRIGTKYDIDDASVTLPAHPRCRCVWLPYMDGWDKPISSAITRNAKMINRVYSPDEIYGKINKRLNIDYASYLKLDDAQRYLTGDRSNSMMDAISDARDKAIADMKDSFEIAMAKADEKMSKEYNTQMKFWKEWVSMNIVDGDSEVLQNSYDAIKGIMILPWTSDQLDGWNTLLKTLKKHM